MIGTIVSALLIHGVPVECINQAAIHYLVPAKVIISVLKTEGGKPGCAKKNKNGTEDLGPMQINTIWLKRVEPYGYNKEKIQYDPCINVMVGTWILSQEIAQGDSYWKGVSGYHSHTRYFRQHYQQKISVQYAELNRVLNHVIN